MIFNLFKNGEYVTSIVGSETFVSAYCEKTCYTYKMIPDDPEPEVETEPTEEDDTAAILVDHEYRLILLELGLTE